MQELKEYFYDDNIPLPADLGITREEFNQRKVDAQIELDDLNNLSKLSDRPRTKDEVNKYVTLFRSVVQC
jgi:hypothetical protein